MVGRTTMRVAWFVVIGLRFAVELNSVTAQDPLPAKTPSLKPDSSDAFFASAPIPRLKIEIASTDLQKLRQNARTYVPCKVIEDDKTEYRDVAVKLKGAAGSFRGIDDRPALTVNFDKYQRGQSFHSLDKLHLNNSVQDGTYLNELVCSKLFLAAGVPAARATHARVWLNGRDLGFYVLKEGFDVAFLKRHFADAKGNLYDGGFCQDFDAALEKDEGKGVDDRSDLKALVEACRTADPARRVQLVGEQLDIDKFLTFMALELMTCHWDGYCGNRNNYRMYRNPATQKFEFFPHGMDQMFGDVNAGVLHVPAPLACSAVLQNPEWRAKYRERVEQLLPLFHPPDRLFAVIDQAHARMRPALAAMNEGLARNQDNHVQAIKERLIARGKNLLQQTTTSEPKPLQFNAQGIAAVTKWYVKSESPDARQEEALLPDKVKAYAISCGPSGRCVASWRSKVLLSAGKYRFQARVKTTDVAALQESQGTGAGLRVSGGQRANKVDGTTGWQAITHELTINNAVQEVELVAELRASKGQAWFDAATMQLVRVP